MRRILVLLTALIGTNFGLPFQAQHDESIANIFVAKENEVCSTPGCIQASENILKNLNESVNPCDDFYEFACGKFISEAVIPDDESMIGTFNILNNVMLEQIKTAVDEPVKPNDIKPFASTKIFYKTCMDTDTIDKDGLDHVKELIKKLGGWPVLEGANWKEDQFDWKNTVHKFRNVGLSASGLLKMYVSEDLYNKSRYMVEYDEANLPINREYLINGFDDDVVKAYNDYLVDLSVLFGADKASAVQDVRDSINFQIELAKITLPNEDRRNFTALTNQIYIRELEKQYPNFPWVTYTNNLLVNPSLAVTPDELINVAVPKYITNLEGLLNKTSNRVLANYLMTEAVNSMVPSLTSTLIDRNLEFMKVYMGTQKLAPRWRDCVTEVNRKYGIATSSMYVRSYFDNESKAIVEGIVKDLKQTFLEILQTVDWMDDITRVRAHEKAEAMESHIAYPNELLDDSKIEEYYTGLEATGKYFEMVLDADKFSVDVSYDNLRQVVNKSDWRVQGEVAMINAFYMPTANSITLPAGILQGTFFDKNRPYYMNYATIGYVIGHEITHGFDDQGRQMDKDGLLVDWWTEATSAEFVKHAQCIIDQYGNYTVPHLNMSVNGITTQGENIADNGGIKEAYVAYNTWVKNHGIEKPLPNLKYTPNQLFWISAANVWCSKERDEMLKLQLLSDPHSPSRFRIIGPFSNAESFSNDFNCVPSSNMNPTHKCTVW